MKDLEFLLAKNKEVVYLLIAKEMIYIREGFLEGIIIYRATENLEKYGLEPSKSQLVKIM